MNDARPANRKDYARAECARLWAHACELVAMLPVMFGEPAAILAAGLSRRLALRCRNWLWSIEGLVRRLIIAAAIALDPASLSLARVKTGTTAPEASRRKGAQGFRIYVFARQRIARARGKEGAARAYGHVPFPADDLLRLGTRAPHPAPAVETRPPEQGSRRTPSPLRRRGRISRRDPDYRGVAEHGASVTHTPASRTAAKRRPLVSSLHPPPAIADWRRVDAEWERMLPAPDLARRIAALLKVVEQPSRLVRRLARRLQRSNLAARLCGLSPPVLRRPRLDATPPGPGPEPVREAHALLRLDTS